MMDTRRANKNNPEIYKQLDKEVKDKCKLTKQKWLEKQCQDIERAHFLNPIEMYKRVKEVSTRNKKKSNSKSNCIKSKEGHIISEKDKVLKRWSEYIKDLYDDERPNVKIIDKNIDGPSILMEEVRYAMKMKTGKATGSDMISIEMTEPLEEKGIEAVTHLLNEMYKTGEMPKDMLKSIFIAIPKKVGTIDCKSHRTISLMSLITKILLRILLIRARNKIKREVSEEQFGFQGGKGTINAIFTLRNVVERCLEKGKEIYICFIDYSKAFDRVQHSKIMDTLQELEIDGNDLRIIRNLYWQ